MKANDLMSDNLAILDIDSTIEEAAIMMQQQNIGCLLITQNTKLVGLITDRDIVTRVVAKNYLPPQSNVMDFMTASPICISTDTDVHLAASIMAEQQVRRLPVLDGDNLVGMLTLGDLAIQAGNEAEQVLEQVSKPNQRKAA